MYKQNNLPIPSPFIESAKQLANFAVIQFLFRLSLMPLGT